MNFNVKAMLWVVLGFALIAMSGCNGVLESGAPKHQKPIPEYLLKKMKTKGMKPSSPILIRIYKDEDALEVWKQDNTGKYAFLATYEICKWSGKLGPKFKEGDRQAPEGFYHVTPGLMNPNSDYYLAFNMGYPNKYDRANDRTGSFLMIHGACSSAGCYSMTDEYVEELYSLARESFKGGQKSFQIQAYPFRLTPENLAKNVNHKDFKFWVMLKEGNDYFELTGKPPKVDVCERRYVFNRSIKEGGKVNSREICPPATMSRTMALAFNEKQEKDQNKFDRLIKQSLVSPFVKTEDKPLVKSASIKAVPTQGLLEVISTKPLVQEKPELVKDKLKAEPDTAKANIEGQEADVTEVPSQVNVVPQARPNNGASVDQGLESEPGNLVATPASAEAGVAASNPVPQTVKRRPSIQRTSSR